MNRTKPQFIRTCQFFKEFTGFARWKLAVSLVVGTIETLTESFGIFLLVPLLSLIGIGENTNMNMKWLPFHPSLEGILAVYVLLVATRGSCSSFLSVWNLRLEQQFLHSLRMRLFKTATESEWLMSLSRLRPSSLLSAMTVEMERVGEAAHLSLSMLNTLLLTIGYSSLAFWVSWKLTSFVLATSGLLFLILRKTAQQVMHDGGHVSKSNDFFFRVSKNILDGIKLIRQNGREKEAQSNWENASVGLLEAYGRSGKRFAYFRGVIEIASAGALAAAVYLSFEVLHLPPAKLLLLLFLFMRLLPRFSSLLQDFNEFTGRLAAFCALERKSVPSDKTSGQLPSREKIKISLSKKMHFENVDFSYNHKTARPVIKNANLWISAGQMTVVTGVSGVGKTTLADLASGLFFPDKGRIWIDETVLTPENAGRWRENISVVTQEAFLFQDTLRANMRWACPEADSTDIEQALQKAGALDLVRSLPEGLDTILGDRGVQLSGGERQRIALARAILSKPSLLILDEPTYSLDTENEDAVLKALLNLAPAMTILCFMHRVPSVLEHSHGYELQDGRLCPKELLLNPIILC